MLPLLVLFVIATSSKAYAEPMPESGLKGDAEEYYDVVMTTRILDNNDDEYWKGSIQGNTQNGEGVVLQLAGEGSFIDLVLVPHTHVKADTVVLFIQGTIWVQQGEDKVRVRNIFKSVRILLDEPVVFAPFGVRDTDNFIARMRALKRSWLQRALSKHVGRRQPPGILEQEDSESEEEDSARDDFSELPRHAPDYEYDREDDDDYDYDDDDDDIYTMELEFVVSRSLQP